MIVVDASVVLNALVSDGEAGDAARQEMARDNHWAAPEHLRVEVASALRRLSLSHQIADARAEDAVEALGAISLDSVETVALLGRMWDLRHNVSAYDAAYVAAAEVLECPLVTADAKLSHATGLQCPVRLALPST